MQVFSSSMAEGAGAYHVAKRLCDLEGRLPIDSVMSDSFQFWTTWRRQLCRLDSAAELTPQVHPLPAQLALPHSLTRPLPHSLTHFLIHLLTLSLTNTITTHSLTSTAFQLSQETAHLRELFSTCFSLLRHHMLGSSSNAVSPSIDVSIQPRTCASQGLVLARYIPAAIGYLQLKPIGANYYSSSLARLIFASTTVPLLQSVNNAL